VGVRTRKIQHRNLPLLLLQARERVISHFRPILKAHDITEQQWRIVRVLLEVEALEPREIAELCGISGPSLTGILTRMQELRLVTRRQMKHDQRRYLVTLTQRGRELASRMAPLIDETYVRLEQLAGSDLCVSLYKALDQLLLALMPGVVNSRKSLPVSPEARELLRLGSSVDDVSSWPRGAIAAAKA
jgi:homoprotocatechuate degradation regulator HpaR